MAQTLLIVIPTNPHAPAGHNEAGKPQIVIPVGHLNGNPPNPPFPKGGWEGFQGVLDTGFRRGDGVSEF
jgi:hypothetical protein